MKLIYTNLGILTEERVRELKESGYDVQECGMAGGYDDEMPLRMGAGYHEMPENEMPAKIIVVRGGLEEDVLEEGDTSSPADGGSVTGTQAANVGPQGTAGSAASGNPGGANTTGESFNRRASALLEAWMEEELHGNQDKLDLDDDGEIEASDLMLLRRGLTDKQVGKDRKRG